MVTTSDKASWQSPDLIEPTLSPGSLLRLSIVERALRIERERIATRLHDEVLQVFATCLIDVQICERLVQTGQHDLLGEELTRLQDALVDAVESIRQLVATLS